MRASALFLIVLPLLAAPADDFRAIVDREVPALFSIYKDLHAHPEISQHEERTSALLAEELRKAGYTVRSAPPRCWRKSCARPATPSPSTSASIRTAAPHLALSRFSATARAPRSWCARTWMPCPSRKKQACPMPARSIRRMTPAKP